MPSPATLVTGTILSVQVISGPSWLPHTEATLLDDAGQTHAFLLPGANGGPPAAVLGVPTLRAGQRWQVELSEAPIGPVPRGHEAGMRSLDPQPVWNLNGNHLDDELLPWPYFMNDEGIAALGSDRTELAVEAALAQWSTVGCSTFAFSYEGRSAEGVEDDGLNVIAWENDSWEWHPDAAAMSVVRFDMSGDLPTIRETDILFNGVSFDWDDETGAAVGASPVLHAGSVLAHELGHSTGMDHEYELITSTMYLAYFGGSWMETLSGDDMRGLCENYPAGADACSDDNDCQGLDSSERFCNEIDGVKVCDELRDPVGSECFIDHINCAEVCLFDSALYSQGSCVLTCPEGSCDPGYSCVEADHTLPLQPGPVCVPEPADTGLDTAPPADTDSPPDDTGDGEPDGCGCSGAPAAPIMSLFLLPLLLRRRR
jgi:uncharacterized protein (TIGR03382 family)